MEIKLNSAIQDFSKEYSEIISKGLSGNLKYKLDFIDSYLIKENFSQAGQDIFVLSCLNGKKNGSFLDLGCNHPIRINNTYLLESLFNWKGLSIDIDSNYTSLYPGLRKSAVMTQDCTKLNFDEILTNYESNHIDFLSLDLEPASITFECLESIPFDRIEFSLITFEHDSYRFGNSFRDKSRLIFEKYGYKLICSDVKNCNCEYEDWYYNPKYINYENIKIFESNLKDWAEILFIL